MAQNGQNIYRCPVAFPRRNGHPLKLRGAKGDLRLGILLDHRPQVPGQAGQLGAVGANQNAGGVLLAEALPQLLIDIAKALVQQPPVELLSQVLGRLDTGDRRVDLAVVVNALGPQRARHGL